MTLDEARKLLGSPTREKLRDMVRRGQADLEKWNLSNEDWEREIADAYRAWKRTHKTPTSTFLHQRAAITILYSDYGKPPPNFCDDQGG